MRAARLLLLAALLAPAWARADQCDFSLPPDQLAACQEHFRQRRAAQRESPEEQRRRVDAAALRAEAARAALLPWYLGLGSLCTAAGLGYGIWRRKRRAAQAPTPPPTEPGPPPGATLQ